MRKLFPVVGHSNTCDRGLKTLLPIFTQASQLFVYTEPTGAFVPNTQGTWEQAIDVIEPAGANSTNAGAFQLAYANRLASYFPDDEIGLVPKGLGGSILGNWVKWNRNSGLYGMACQRIDWAKDNGELTGLVIWLGENDCSTTASADLISQQLTNLISWFRVDLRDLNLPVVLIKPGNENGKALAGWTNMRAQFDLISMYNVAVVNTDDINANAGDVHFNTANYVLIGERAADTMYSLLS